RVVVSDGPDAPALDVLSRRPPHQFAQLAEGNLCLVQATFSFRELFGIAREPVSSLHDERAHRGSRFSCLAPNIAWQSRAAVKMLTHVLSQICAAAWAQVLTTPDEI